jgi:hypothetical protein
MEKYLSVAVITILFASLTVVCSKDKTQAEDNELVVLCGSSFSNPMSELCSQLTEQTGIKFATTVAGSEYHLPLIKTAHKDLFSGEVSIQEPVSSSTRVRIGGVDLLVPGKLEKRIKFIIRPESNLLSTNPISGSVDNKLQVKLVCSRDFGHFV